MLSQQSDARRKARAAGRVVNARLERARCWVHHDGTLMSERKHFDGPTECAEPEDFIQDHFR